MIFGKNWQIKAGANAFLGPGLIKAGEQLMGEVRNRNIQDKTIAQVGVHVTWCLTRIGVFAGYKINILRKIYGIQGRNASMYRLFLFFIGSF